MTVVAVPAPMLAVAGRPPDDADWAVEMKWDGVRAIVVCRGGECRLYSRNQRDITGSYPELAGALGAVAGGRELVLDGEIIAQTATGAPSFALLQRRMHVVRPTKQLIAAVPVQLHLFDILADGGDSLTGLPYLRRRDRLQELDFTEAPVRTPPHWLDVDAEHLMAAARDNHLEGIVSKRIDSTYQPGRRSPAWIKTPLRKNTEAIVTGWTTGNGAMAPTFGSLILGANDPIGNAGCWNLRNSPDDARHVASPGVHRRSV